MRLKLYFAIFAIVSIVFSLNTIVFASKIYRRVPFVLSINPDDILIINYDFSEKKGVRCISNTNQIISEFTYKGRQKLAHVPVVLESARIPDHQRDKEHEELANTHGQFTLNVDKTQMEAGLLVSCAYVE